MKNSIFAKNMELLGNAGLTKLGKELVKLGLSPIKKASGPEVSDLVDMPLVRLALVNMGVGGAAGYGVITNAQEAFAQAMVNAAWDDLINAVPDKTKAEIMAEYNSVIGTPVHMPAAPVVGPAANTTKGNAKVISPVFASKPGGAVDPRYAKEPAANTAEGGENVEVLTEQGDDDVPYLPTKRDDLLKDDKNLCICPNPFGKEPHSKQKDKFQPWQCPGGYREDLKNVLICGGCRDFGTAEGMKVKKAADAEKAALEKNTKLEAEKATLEETIASMDEKIAKSKKTEATFIGLLNDDPGNEDVTKSLSDVQKKIKDLNDVRDKAFIRLDEIEAILNPDANKGNQIKEPDANTTKGNTKVSTSATARLQQHKGKK